MSSVVTCEKCFSTFRVREFDVGKRFRCSRCGHVQIAWPEPAAMLPPTPPIATPPQYGTGLQYESPTHGIRRSWFYALGERMHYSDPNKATWKVIGMTILGLAFTIAIPFITVSMISLVSESFASNHWAKTSATIRSAEMTRKFHRYGRSYYPHVSYTYKVDQQSFTGERITLDTQSPMIKEEMPALLDKYHVGSVHEVRYDPDDPSRCVLEPGTRWQTWVLASMPLFFLIGPPLVLLYGSVVWYRLTRPAEVTQAPPTA